MEAMTGADLYVKGDWIVHARYGVGCVKGLDRKQLDGKEKIYLKVETFNGSYWLPVEKVNVEYIRRVAPEKRFELALELIQQSAEPLPDNYRQRQQYIAETILEGSLIMKARLLRDLFARRKQKKLTIREDDTLHQLMRQFINEWSVSSSIDPEEAQERLEAALR